MPPVEFALKMNASNALKVTQKLTRIHTIPSKQMSYAGNHQNQKKNQVVRHFPHLQLGQLLEATVQMVALTVMTRELASVVILVMNLGMMDFVFPTVK
jgi:hypothetical protein